jgi:hypothetical protein
MREERIEAELSGLKERSMSLLSNIQNPQAMTMVASMTAPRNVHSAVMDTWYTRVAQEHPVEVMRRKILTPHPELLGNDVYEAGNFIDSEDDMLLPAHVTIVLLELARVWVWLAPFVSYRERRVEMCCEKAIQHVEDVSRSAGTVCGE